MPGMNGANEFTADELDQLFSDEFEQTPPSANDNIDGQDETDGADAETTNPETDETTNPSVDETKAFAKRLKKSTEKAIAKEREAIAKSLGFNSFDELQKSRENKVLEENGLDPEQASKTIDELVKQRLADDPRLKELEEYRKERIKEFGKKELAEITKLTGGKVTAFSQLSEEVINLWKAGGSLKSAYLSIEGENLISELRSGHNKGSTAHLKSAGGSNPMPASKRALTDKEKEVWKYFNPQMTEEDLNKIMVDK